jgi:hypothetical protein
MTIGGYTITRLTVGVIGIILVIGLIAFGTSQCAMRRNAATQARVDNAQGSAFQSSASDAVGTLDGTQGNALATEQTGDQHETAIRAAPGDAPIAPAINRAARRGMCDYRANRNKPECVVHKPDPK